VVARQVDQRVGRVEIGVLEGRQRRRCREVDGVGQGPLEAIEVGGGVTDRDEQPLRLPGVCAFQRIERLRERRAVPVVGRPLDGVVEIQEDAMAGRDVVAVLVGREGVVPGVLARGQGGGIGHARREVGFPLPVQAGRERRRAPDGDRRLHEGPPGDARLAWLHHLPGSLGSGKKVRVDPRVPRSPGRRSTARNGGQRRRVFPTTALYPGCCVPSVRGAVIGAVDPRGASVVIPVYPVRKRSGVIRTRITPSAVSTSLPGSCYRVSFGLCRWT
jgi:hypothetical protein